MTLREQRRGRGAQVNHAGGDGPPRAGRAGRAGTGRGRGRARRIAMPPEEVAASLAAERTCRVATVGADGRPHVVPLWFAWDGRALWLTSLVRSQRWTDLTRDP